MIKKNEDESGSSGSTGGAGGGIQFHDFLGGNKPQRDDLSPVDIKQLLAQHDVEHRHHVEKQLEKQKNREALKNGNMSLNEFRHGKGQNSQYKAHPILQDKLRGIDSKENPLANVNESDVNDEARLENKVVNRPAPGIQPRFTPPRLTR